LPVAAAEAALWPCTACGVAAAPEVAGLTLVSVAALDVAVAGLVDAAPVAQAATATLAISAVAETTSRRLVIRGAIRIYLPLILARPGGHAMSVPPAVSDGVNAAGAVLTVPLIVRP